MKIGIFSNLKRDNNGDKAKSLALILKNKGIDFCLNDDLNFLDIEADFYPTEELAKKSDIIVTLGGDGTILAIAALCAKYNSKIFAVNLGNLGFLTEIQDVNYNKFLEYIQSGKEFVIDKRSLLSVKFKDKKYYALNEVVVARGARTKLIKLEVKINDQLVDRYKSDGIILASPSGSTAYSLSAGGPVVIPDVKAFILTPIATHSLHSRPYVVSDNSVTTIKLYSKEHDAYLNVDGKDVEVMKYLDFVKIKKSNKYVEFIRFDGFNYYDRILEKMCRLSIVNHCN